MDRRQALLQYINLETQVGAEIGPLNRPVVKKSEGQIYYIDYTTLEQLKEIHQVDPGIPLDEICGPDFIWGKQTLRELFGPIAPIDYLIASHVLEHVPNMVGWLREVSSVLKPGGILALALPDKRFTFDFIRPLTSLGDVLEAHWSNVRRPSPRHVWDAVSMSVKLDAAKAWRAYPNLSDLEKYHPTSKAMDAVGGILRNPESYYDCHCWVFTPRHMLEIWKQLAELNLFDFEVVSIQPTVTDQIEFFVTLRKLEDGPMKLEKQRQSFAQFNLSDDYELVKDTYLIRRAIKDSIPGPIKRVLKKLMFR